MARISRISGTCVTKAQPECVACHKTQLALLLARLAPLLAILQPHCGAAGILSNMQVQTGDGSGFGNHTGLQWSESGQLQEVQCPVLFFLPQDHMQQLRESECVCFN